MSTKTADGFQLCMRHDPPVQAWVQTVKTQDTNTLPVTFMTCPSCDRKACPECGTIDMTGKVMECCGVSLKVDAKPKKK